MLEEAAKEGTIERGQAPWYSTLDFLLQMSKDAERCFSGWERVTGHGRGQRRVQYRY